MDQVTLRVSPRLPLPHVVLLRSAKAGKKVPHQFAPDCAVDADVAKALLETQGGNFAKATGKPNMDDYTFRESFKRESILQIFEQLTDEEKLELHGIAQEMIDNRGKGAKQPQGPRKPAETNFEKMTIAQLEDFAADQKPPIEIPEDATLKKDVIAAIEEELRRRAAASAQ